MGLPPPPRTPAQFRFPGAVGMVFDFPRLCRRRRGRARSLSPGICPSRPKCAPPVSGLAKLFPGGTPTREQRPVRMSAETAFESVEASASQLAAYIPGSAFGGATTLLLQSPRSFALFRGPSYLG
jgi:hypothetical protein